MGICSIVLTAKAYVLKRFTMVPSLSSDLPLDSPRFNNLFFISSCIRLPGIADAESPSSSVSLGQGIELKGAASRCNTCIWEIGRLGP